MLASRLWRVRRFVRARFPRTLRVVNALVGVLLTLSPRRFMVTLLLRARLISFDEARFTARAARKAARAGLRALDARFRPAYRALLDDPRLPLLPRSAFKDRALLTMIGSLGPGGAERQLVTLLRGLPTQDDTQLDLVARFLDTEVDNFFRPHLADCPVRISPLRWNGDPEGGLLEEFPDQDRLRQVVGAHAHRLPAEVGEIWHYLREILVRRPGVFHGWMDDVNVKGGIASALAGVPRIVLGTRSVAPDNFALFQPFMRTAYQLLLRLPQVTVLNNSDAGARDYERWLDVPRGTVKVVRNGFDFAAFDAFEAARARLRYRQRFGVGPDERVVGTIIRFSEEKQPFLWLEAAVRVAEMHADTRFLMVGDGRLREAVRSRGLRAGLGTRLLLPGYESDARPALAAMDLFLLTSRVEGLPNVLIEAQAMGVPVVAADAGGTAEAFRPGESGWLVRRRDAVGFAEVVSEALSDRSALGEAGRRARETVRQSFDDSRMVREILGHYGWPISVEASVLPTPRCP